jgi:predicted nucleotidyltransferase
MNEPEARQLEDALHRALAEASGVVSAYVFGSVAAGQGHRQSDLDVGVLLDWGRYPRREQRFEARLRLIACLGSTLHRNDLDLVILNDAAPHLAREVVTRGRRVFCADNEANHAFVRTSMLRAADLEPFLRRTRRVKLSALER